LDHAIYDCENTDILLVMGTSLTVQPVASYRSLPIGTTGKW
jgi:NAD-dependent SIR2 family protein deacetylase